jgi:hypothetical protein
MTLSARTKTLGGIVRPICFAALRLTIKAKRFARSKVEWSWVLNKQATRIPHFMAF